MSRSSSSSSSASSNNNNSLLVNGEGNLNNKLPKQSGLPPDTPTRLKNEKIQQHQTIQQDPLRTNLTMNSRSTRGSRGSRGSSVNSATSHSFSSGRRGLTPENSDNSGLFPTTSNINNNNNNDNQHRNNNNDSSNFPVVISESNNNNVNNNVSSAPGKRNSSASSPAVAAAAAGGKNNSGRNSSSVFSPSFQKKISRSNSNNTSYKINNNSSSVVVNSFLGQEQHENNNNHNNNHEEEEQEEETDKQLRQKLFRNSPESSEASIFDNYRDEYDQQEEQQDQERVEIEEKDEEKQNETESEIGEEENEEEEKEEEKEEINEENEIDNKNKDNNNNDTNNPQIIPSFTEEDEKIFGPEASEKIKQAIELKQKYIQQENERQQRQRDILSEMNRLLSVPSTSTTTTSTSTSTTENNNNNNSEKINENENEEKSEQEKFENHLHTLQRKEFQEEQTTSRVIVNEALQRFEKVQEVCISMQNKVLPDAMKLSESLQQQEFALQLIETEIENVEVEKHQSQMIEDWERDLQFKEAKRRAMVANAIGVAKVTKDVKCGTEESLFCLEAPEIQMILDKYDVKNGEEISIGEGKQEEISTFGAFPSSETSSPTSPTEKRQRRRPSPPQLRKGPSFISQTKLNFELPEQGDVYLVYCFIPMSEFSRMWEICRESSEAALMVFKECVSSLAEANRGNILDANSPTGFLLSFELGSCAITFSIELQQLLLEVEFPETLFPDILSEKKRFEEQQQQQENDEILLRSENKNKNDEVAEVETTKTKTQKIPPELVASKPGATFFHPETLKFGNQQQKRGSTITTTNNDNNTMNSSLIFHGLRVGITIHQASVSELARSVLSPILSGGGEESSNIFSPSRSNVFTEGFQFPRAHSLALHDNNSNSPITTTNNSLLSQNNSNNNNIFPQRFVGPDMLVPISLSRYCRGGEILLSNDCWQTMLNARPKNFSESELFSNSCHLHLPAEELQNIVGSSLYDSIVFPSLAQNAGMDDDDEDENEDEKDHESSFFSEQTPKKAAVTHKSSKQFLNVVQLFPIELKERAKLLGLPLFCHSAIDSYGSLLSGGGGHDEDVHNNKNKLSSPTNNSNISSLPPGFSSIPLLLQQITTTTKFPNWVHQEGETFKAAAVVISVPLLEKLLKQQSFGFRCWEMFRNQISECLEVVNTIAVSASLPISLSSSAKSPTKSSPTKRNDVRSSPTNKSSNNGREHFVGFIIRQNFQETVLCFKNSHVACTFSLLLQERLVSLKTWPSMLFEFNKETFGFEFSGASSLWRTLRVSIGIAEDSSMMLLTHRPSNLKFVDGPSIWLAVEINNKIARGGEIVVTHCIYEKILKSQEQEQEKKSSLLEKSSSFSSSSLLFSTLPPFFIEEISESLKEDSNIASPSSTTSHEKQKNNNVNNPRFKHNKSLITSSEFTLYSLFNESLASRKYDLVGNNNLCQENLTSFAIFYRDLENLKQKNEGRFLMQMMMAGGKSSGGGGMFSPILGNMKRFLDNTNGSSSSATSGANQTAYAGKLTRQSLLQLTAIAGSSLSRVDKQEYVDVLQVAHSGAISDRAVRVLLSIIKGGISCGLVDEAILDGIPKRERGFKSFRGKMLSMSNINIHRPNDDDENSSSDNDSDEAESFDENSLSTATSGRRKRNKNEQQQKNRDEGKSREWNPFFKKHPKHEKSLNTSINDGRGISNDVSFASASSSSPTTTGTTTEQQQQMAASMISVKSSTSSTTKPSHHHHHHHHRHHHHNPKNKKTEEEEENVTVEDLEIKRKKALQKQQRRQRKQELRFLYSSSSSSSSDGDEENEGEISSTQKQKKIEKQKRKQKRQQEKVSGKRGRYYQPDLDEIHSSRQQQQQRQKPLAAPPLVVKVPGINISEQQKNSAVVVAGKALPTNASLLPSDVGVMYDIENRAIPFEDQHRDKDDIGDVDYHQRNATTTPRKSKKRGEGGDQGKLNSDFNSNKAKNNDNEENNNMKEPETISTKSSNVKIPSAIGRQYFDQERIPDDVLLQLKQLQKQSNNINDNDEGRKEDEEEEDNLSPQNLDEQSDPLSKRLGSINNNNNDNMFFDPSSSSSETTMIMKKAAEKQKRKQKLLQQNPTALLSLMLRERLRDRLFDSATYSIVNKKSGDQEVRNLFLNPNNNNNSNGNNNDLDSMNGLMDKIQKQQEEIEKKRQKQQKQKQGNVEVDEEEIQQNLPIASKLTTKQISAIEDKIDSLKIDDLLVILKNVEIDTYSILYDQGKKSEEEIFDTDIRDFFNELLFVYRASGLSSFKRKDIGIQCSRGPAIVVEKETVFANMSPVSSSYQQREKESMSSSPTTTTTTTKRNYRSETPTTTTSMTTPRTYNKVFQFQDENNKTTKSESKIKTDLTTMNPVEKMNYYLKKEQRKEELGEQQEKAYEEEEQEEIQQQQQKQQQRNPKLQQETTITTTTSTSTSTTKEPATMVITSGTVATSSDLLGRKGRNYFNYLDASGGIKISCEQQQNENENSSDSENENDYFLEQQQQQQQEKKAKKQQFHENEKEFIKQRQILSKALSEFDRYSKIPKLTDKDRIRARRWFFEIRDEIFEPILSQIFSSSSTTQEKEQEEEENNNNNNNNNFFFLLKNHLSPSDLQQATQSLIKWKAKDSSPRKDWAKRQWHILFDKWKSEKHRKEAAFTTSFSVQHAMFELVIALNSRVEVNREQTRDLWNFRLRLMSQTLRVLLRLLRNSSNSSSSSLQNRTTAKGGRNENSPRIVNTEEGVQQQQQQQEEEEQLSSSPSQQQQQQQTVMFPRLPFAIPAPPEDFSSEQDEKENPLFSSALASARALDRLHSSVDDTLSILLKHPPANAASSLTTTSSPSLRKTADIAAAAAAATASTTTTTTNNNASSPLSTSQNLFASSNTNNNVNNNNVNNAQYFASTPSPPKMSIKKNNNNSKNVSSSVTPSPPRFTFSSSSPQQQQQQQQHQSPSTARKPANTTRTRKNDVDDWVSQINRGIKKANQQNKTPR